MTREFHINLAIRIPFQIVKWIVCTLYVFEFTTFELRFLSEW
jgi:hypothetical protein